jgi:hypothetical protein
MRLSSAARTPDRRGAGQSDEVLRASGVFGLVAVAVVHFSQIVPTIQQTPWLGVGFLLLSAACVALASQLLERSTRGLWLGVAAVNVFTILGYVFTRAVSTPLDNQDVGNWSETLGVTALFIEGLMVLLSIRVLWRIPRPVVQHQERRRRVRDLVRI